MQQRASHPPALRAVATIPARRYSVRQTVIARADSGYGMLRAGEKSTHHAKPSSSPAQSWSVMQMVLSRFPQTPRCSRKLRGNFRADAPCGVACATSIYLCPVGLPASPA